MSNTNKLLLTVAGFSLLLAAVLGAYGSHALAPALAAEARHAYETAVAYHFYHSFGLIAVGLLGERCRGRLLPGLSGTALIAGIILFCGSIYATTLGAPAVLGRAAPAGGLLFMLGWLAFALAALTVPGPGAARETHRASDKIDLPESTID